jgi:hypothetical protein
LTAARDPLQLFLVTGRAYTEALDTYRDSRDDAKIDAAKAE